MKIGISGAEGSFSEQAAKEYCQAEGIENPELVYLTFVDAVLTALEAGEIDRGIFAIENSNGGVVTEYLPAIAAHRFSIQKIFEMEVAHALLARGGTRKEEIRIIISQNQALRQCRMYVKRMFPSAEVVE
ncbi:MAG: prephenate dehydratase domain-containing protein, partial [Patescibacteria group bacterium]